MTNTPQPSPMSTDKSSDTSALTPQPDKKKEDETKALERGEWGHKLDFMMSCVGFAVGLGNIWRFPYLCYKNGGGAFMIPYFVCLVLSGVPVFFMETSIGQLLGQGFLSIWVICPVLKGLGYCSLILIFWLNTYYIVVISWSLYYLVRSFSWPVPWSTCGHEWNSPLCASNEDLQAQCRAYYLKHKPSNELIFSLANSSQDLNPKLLRQCITALNKNFVDPVREYWENHVLKTTPGIDTSGGLCWGTTLTLIGAWFICFWAMYRGIRTTGKIVYVTALFPYVCLTILFLRGITLEGAFNGIIYFLKPDMSRILDPNVWNDAATQVFYANGVGIGAWIALSSYNKFNNDVLRDTLIIAAINGATALFSGLTVFSIIGFMAYQQNRDISEVASSGSGLTFIVYPSATLKMPFVQLWSALFFVMMIMLGLGSEFVQLESFFTGIIDEWPAVLRQHRPLFIAVCCAVKFVGGLALVSRGGIYWFELFDFFAASGFALLFLIFVETVAIFWFYGADNYISRIEYMLNRKIGLYWIVCWKYLTPILCLMIFIFSLVKFKRFEYVGYQYPDWAIAFGWFIALSSMVAVPVFALFSYSQLAGSFKERWRALVSAKHQEIDRIIRERANTVPTHKDKPLPPGSAKVLPENESSKEVATGRDTSDSTSGRQQHSSGDAQDSTSA